MKKIIYILLLLLGITFYSCSEDDLDPNSVIADTELENDFDRWILANYTLPYNMTIKYKLQDIEASKSYYLAPAIPEKSKALGIILQHVWMGTYNEVMGEHFFKEHSPKILFFVGSYAYDSDGSITLGTAESGMKVTLYGVNEINTSNVSAASIRGQMKTVIHEFSHILHQKKSFDPEFDKISQNDYIADSWSASTSTEAIAYSLGFVSRYARKNINEDFVEMISIYVVYGQDNWDSILARAGTDGAAKIQQKLAIVKNYLRDTWSMDIDELRTVFEERLNSVNELDLN